METQRRLTLFPNQQNLEETGLTKDGKRMLYSPGYKIKVNKTFQSLDIIFSQVTILLF